MGFAELCAVSNFSFLEGASHPEELVATAKALGLPALALADRNTLAGVVRAHVAAKAEGLRLIIGARLDIEDGPPLVCLPRDRQAYGRLCRLLSLGQMRAPKAKCRLTLDDVGAHAEGQVVIILPPEQWDWRQEAASEGAGDLERMVLRVREEVASSQVYLAAACTYDCGDRARLAMIGRIARRASVPVAATNAVRFHDPGRRRLADVLCAIRAGTTVAAAGWRLQANAERHLKSPYAMARLFADYPEAIANTLRIADLCRFSLDELVYEYPDEPVPYGKTPDEHLSALAWAGARERFVDGIPRHVEDTLGKELALIAGLKYAPYFLTVNDIVQFARGRGILAQGRGSAANSVVCYCLGITAVNPAEADLLFERFISAERREPPDIDVDFEHERREEVIQYIYTRYGRDRAGLAATVISYRARSAVREVGKVMGLSADTLSALSGMVWGTRSGGALPDKHVREAGLDPADPLLKTALELASELIGFPRHLSQHVGGFVLTRGPLVEVVPVGNAAMADRTFIEWDKDDLAALGLLKVDVLALGMLSCIRRAFDLIRTHYGRSLTLAAIPREDPAVYDMLCRADSIGVFQVESRAQMNMLPRLKPRTFYDLVIEVAIVRPGPIQGDMVHPYLRRRAGVEPEVYPAPAPEHGPPDELKQILGKTKGVPLFQEQAMRIAMEAAKFSDGEVNELRKSMATFRKRGTIGLLEEKMVSRMVARGYPRAFAERCFNQIKGFGEYGFPESHAASFALLVYASAWLKCHYPEVFACALINAQPMGFYAPAQIVRDAREHGVTVLAPDAGMSAYEATLEVDREGAVERPRNGLPVRLGLSQIEGLSERDAERVVEGARASPRLAQQGSLQELVRRAGLKRGALEKIASADGVRSLGLDRRQALWEVCGFGQAEPLPLFAWAGAPDVGPEPAAQLQEMPLSEHVVADYQTLRLSLKAHPLSFLRARFAALPGARVLPAAGLRDVKDGAFVSVAGLVLVRQRPGSAKGVVFMTIEDETGVANAIVWPKTLERYRGVVMGARLVLIHGQVQRHESIIHVVSRRLEDRSDWLGLLSDGAFGMKIPIANADEVLRPEPGSERASAADQEAGADKVHPRFARPSRPSHPRAARVMPKSRDFH